MVTVIHYVSFGFYLYNELIFYTYIGITNWNVCIINVIKFKYFSIELNNKIKFSIE